MTVVSTAVIAVGCLSSSLFYQKYCLRDSPVVNKNKENEITNASACSDFAAH